MTTAIWSIKTQNKMSGTMNGAVPQRKRIERACRRRKMKCSGEKMCKSCAASNLPCSFRSDLKTVRGPAYVTHLERTVKELEGQSEHHPSTLSRRTDSMFDSAGDSSSTGEQRDTDRVRLQTLGYPTGCFVPRSTNTASQYGSCCGIETLRRMRVYLDAAIGSPVSTPLVFELTNSLDRPLHELFSSPSSAYHVFSPPQADLLHYIDVAFREAFWLRPFVSRDFVEAIVRQVYDTKSKAATPYRAKDEIALIYAIAAIGEFLDTDRTIPVDGEVEERGWRGITYFRTVQSLVDHTNCERSLLALQTVICISIYLVTTSAITRAHMYINIAAAAAVRIGLHLPSTGLDVPQHERQARKRTYRSIKALDIYTATFLGIPSCLQGLYDDHDDAMESVSESMSQSLPLDDVEVASSASMEAFTILRDATHEAYFNGFNPGDMGVYSFPSSIIRNHNGRLDDWSSTVPKLALSGRLQLQVRQTGAYVQMMLNSPFLHYLTVPSAQRSNDGVAAGIKCVTAAIQMMELLSVLKQQRLLNVAHSFTLRSLVFAAMNLLFVEFSALDIRGMEAIKAASGLAEQLLRNMAQRHVAALGCYESLQPLYQLKQQLAQSMPDLTSSGNTSAWATPTSTDDLDAAGSSPMASRNVAFTGNVTSFQRAFDSY